MSLPSRCLKRISPEAGRPASTSSSMRRRSGMSSGCTIPAAPPPRRSAGSRPSMRANAGLHWMTSVVPSSLARLTSMPTSAEVNIRSKSSRAAASSRAVALAIGHVERDAAEADDRAARVADRELERPDVARCARARIGDGLVEADGDAAAHDPAVVRRELLEHLGLEGLRHRPADELLGPLAHDRARLRIGDDPALVEIAHVDRHGAVVEDRLEPGIGLRELLLRELLRRDVARGHGGGDDAAAHPDRAERRFVERRRRPRSADGS